MFASGKTNAVANGTANYIEDVFSTYLYTGNGTSQTITNGIDLSTKGGLVWVKSRSSALNHLLVDTARGANRTLASNTTAGQIIEGGVTAFNTTGFDIDNIDRVNTSSVTYASWTFRKQPKFFDVVTYTGTGSVQNIAHSLGSVPGFMVVKATDNATNWVAYHRSYGGTYRGVLNSTTSFGLNSTMWNDTDPTSTVFTVGTNLDTNTSGKTYVAYLFAHDAGGFGLTGTDNVISCGSFTTNGSGNATVSLGYEPQWVLFKRSDGASSWELNDAMRGNPVDSTVATNTLRANTSAAEVTNSSTNSFPTSTGFNFVGGASMTYIYIAIRRGPMKVPTSGTSVFAPVVVSAPSSNQVVTTNFPVDMSWSNAKQSSSYGTIDFDRLRGATKTNSAWLIPYSTDSEGTTGSTSTLTTQSNTSIIDNWWPIVGYSTGGVVYWNFRRAPSFFDVVCYTGTQAYNTQISHNLGAVPELLIVKQRSAVNDWFVLGTNLSTNKLLYLNYNVAAEGLQGASFGTTGDVYVAPTSSIFTLGNTANTNASGGTYVAYLFATCAGVSKVGTYTGTGALQTVNCGFTSGARFVLIKRTDSTGDWYVYDSARGITSGNDPYLLLNSINAEVTGTNYVDTDSTGFKVTAAAPAALNASGGTYIFLAIA